MTPEPVTVASNQWQTKREQGPANQEPEERQIHHQTVSSYCRTLVPKTPVSQTLSSRLEIQLRSVHHDASEVAEEEGDAARR